MVVKGENAEVSHNEIAYNNFAGFAAGWEAGGTKFVRTTNLAVYHNCVHDNRGPGLWTDFENVETRYRHNIVFHNFSEGIFHEISGKAWIAENAVGANGSQSAGWLYGANILVATSSRVTVERNYVEVAPGYGNGIVVLWQKRGEAVDNTVRSNDVVYLGRSGFSGIGADFDLARAQAPSRNHFDRNRYYMESPESRHFVLNESRGPLGWIREKGQELNARTHDLRPGIVWGCDLDIRKLLESLGDRSADPGQNS